MNRLRIIRRLAAAPATVSELVEHVGLSQPLVSWHVGKLRLAGLADTRRNGRERVVRLRRDAFDAFAAHERAALGLGVERDGIEDAPAATAEGAPTAESDPRPRANAASPIAGSRGATAEAAS